MIKPEELYEKTKIPADEKTLDTLMQLFFNIPFDELNCNENRLIYLHIFQQINLSFLLNLQMTFLEYLQKCIQK